MIKRLIEENTDFYRSSATIKWCINLFDDGSIVGTCDRKTRVVSINLISINKAIRENNMKEIEYFLLHEIRHAFQHEIIEDYLKGEKNLPISKNLIEQWIIENKNYIPAKDKEGNENEEYFKQDIEFDAYAYSFSVMKYKYGLSKNDLFVPKSYGEEFDKIVDGFINEYLKEGIRAYHE